MRRASSTSGAALDYDDDHNVKYVVDESSMMTMVTMVINDDDGDDGYDGYDGDNDDDLRSTGATPPLHQSTWQRQLTIWRGPIFHRHSFFYFYLHSG